MKTTNKIECAAPQRVGRQPLGGAASLISPLFSLSPIHIYTFLLYISHSILTGVAFCVYAVRCFVRIIERIRRIFVFFS